MMGTAVLFPKRSSAATDAIRTNPGRTLLAGFGAFLLVGIVAFAFLSNPLPFSKLLGLALATGLLAIAAIGAGGLALLIGERLRTLKPEMTPYDATSIGAALVFLGALTPVLGTFLLAPASLFVSIGAGVRALFGREAVARRSEL
jgi:hypothetical protein